MTDETATGQQVRSNDSLGVTAENQCEHTLGMVGWQQLHGRFAKLREITGAEKSSSYSLDVSFEPYGDIRVHLGTYDIGDWPRHTYLGPFATESEAIAATLKKIEQAERAVAHDA